MLKILQARLHQGHRTMLFPDAAPPAMPPHFRGRPIFDLAKCPSDCKFCADACPTKAITIERSDGAGTFLPHQGASKKNTANPQVDLGRCLFCTDCQEACPASAIHYSDDYRLSVRQRADLIVDPEQELKLAAALDKKLMKLFGRSLKLRQVSAGGCNACEADVNVLNTVGWDLSRFGIQFVASPRHADGLLITGPVTENMRLALKKTNDAVPSPKIVIAVGACAISGGPYIDHPEAQNGAETSLPVDLFIPGCPPHPLTILDGLLRLLNRIDQNAPTGPVRPKARTGCPSQRFCR